MDNGPLWSQDPHGNYWLLFPNKHALSKDKIKNIFSQFGVVKMVTESGDEKGLRFVQYSCLDDVKQAVEGLNNHPQIKLVPYRPKTKNNQNSNVIRAENGSNDASKRNFFQRKPTINSNDRKSNEQLSSNEGNTIDFQNIEYESNYDGTSVCSSNASKNMENFSVNSHCGYNTKTNLTSPTYSLKSAVHPEDKVKMLLKIRGINSSSFNPHVTNNNSNFDCIYEDELPSLVTSYKAKTHAVSKKVIYNADEVIVANIPDEYGSAYILHLFEKFEPLAISHIKIASKNNVRYCHVYFKSADDSMGVEAMFDKYDLSGKKLVVLRPCNLEEELVI